MSGEAQQAMDPIVMEVEDTIHEMANSLSRLRTEDYYEEITPRKAPTSELPKLLSTSTCIPSLPSPPGGRFVLPLVSQYSLSPPASPERDAVIPWPTADGESTYIRPSQEFLQRRPSIKSNRSSIQVPNRRMSVSSSRHTRSSSSTSVASYMGSSPYPAPLKPLPAVPSSARPSKRTSTQPSHLSSPSTVSSASGSDLSSVDMDRFSQSSGTNSIPSRSSLQSVRVRPTVPPRPPEHLRPGQLNAQQKPYSYEGPGHYQQDPYQQDYMQEDYSPQSQTQRSPYLPESHQQQHQPNLLKPLEVVYWKQLWGAEKKKSGKSNSIHYTDLSTRSSTVATKHGNQIIKVWSVASGTVKSTIKFSSYIEAQARGREYMIRSHTILSEANQLIALSTHFGRTLEIWSWEKPKRLQTIDDVDRWVSGRFESYDSGWSPLAAYRGKDSIIDLYAATTRDKKPFAKVRSIDMRKADLPFVPQYPELAISPTSHLLVAAAGPRTARAGHPPPDRETLLVAWDISDYREVSNKPYRVVRPWQHRELETALPCSLVAYGDLIISLWIPSGFRTVAKPGANGDTEYTLAPTTVPFRYVLVWDLSENSTRTYGIPNTTSCISPDCRFVAYCKVAERRSKLAILDVSSGTELWALGGECNLTSLEQVGDLSKVTDLAFSADGRFLSVGDRDGNSSIFDVRDAMK